MEEDKPMDNVPSQDTPSPAKSPSDAIKISDRERMLQTGTPLAVDKTQLRKRVVAKHNIPQTKQMVDSPKQNHDNMDVEAVPQTKQMIQSPKITKSNDNLQNTKPTWKNYCCDKCKVCDEFETKNPKGSICDNCGCDLIFHLRDGEESPLEDEDAYEWQDEDSDEDEEDDEEEEE